MLGMSQYQPEREIDFPEPLADAEKASDYHDAARVSFRAKRNPKFNDKEKIILEIYAERQNDVPERKRYLDLARAETHNHEQDIAFSR